MLGISSVGKSVINDVSQMHSTLHKSYSGFDIGQQKACGSFFSNVRQQASGIRPNFYSSEQMRGTEYIDKLIKQQEDRYHKRLPFERG